MAHKVVKLKVTRRQVLIKLNKEKKLGNEWLRQANEAKSEDIKNRCLRIRNHIMERVYTLEWVLGIK